MAPFNSPELKQRFKEKTTIRFEDFDFNQLRCPDLLGQYLDDDGDDAESEDGSNDSKSNASGGSPIRSWLDPELIPPPMPINVFGTGGLNPNEIKARALENGGNIEFQQRLMTFLEDAISTSIPPKAQPGLEVPLSQYHPCTTRGPPPSTKPEDWEDAQANDFHKLARLCQFHTHARTCYKYWKGPGFEKESCFDLDEANVRPMSVFNSETGSFELRCLDGLAHIAYAALELAATKLGDFNPEEDEFSARARRLLQKCAYPMVAQQEHSGQQVASYIMGFEDHFASHKYVNLYWASLGRFINLEPPSPECYSAHRAAEKFDITTDSEADSGSDSDEDGEPGNYITLDDPGDMDEVRLTMGPNGNFVASANQVADYQGRGPELSNVHIWDFVAQVEEVRNTEACRKHKKTDEKDVEPSDPVQGAISDDSPMGDEEPSYDDENILFFN
ncbi:hypothetical protein B0H19DRAFT_1080235 [Mycena capillaripes]|nr:hypothetical protein B0H19DRAFT_1080235 [Mycena capillaripes]